MAAPAPDRHFESMYRRHAGDVYRFALAVVRNPAEAEDVTQTTFLNAYRALKRGDSPQRPRSWLFAIAHNAIRSRHRWTLRRPKEVPLENEVHRLAVRDEERENVVDVLKALGELPQNQREALAMRELEGLSYHEIAETLGVSVPAVESLISRGRRTLRMQRAKLRSLIVLPLPQSLRALLEQASSGNGGLAAKAAALVVAATAVAGGVVTHDTGQAMNPAHAGPTTRSGAYALLPSHAKPATHAPAPARRVEVRTHAHKKKISASASVSGSGTVTGTGRGSRTAVSDDRPADAPPAATAPAATAPAAAPPAATPEPAAGGGTAPSPAPAVTTAVTTTVVPAVPAPLPDPVDPLPVTVPTVTLPAVPSLPPPPTVTAPQVTVPGGIK